MQYKLKNRSSPNIIFLAEVLPINSALEYFVRWLIIRNVYGPFENGLKKYRSMTCNVSEGVGCDINLCRSCDGVIDLQGVHKSDT